MYYGYFLWKWCPVKKSPKYKRRRRLAAIFAASVLGAGGLAANAVMSDNPSPPQKPHKPPTTHTGKTEKPKKPHVDKKPVHKKPTHKKPKPPVSGKDYYLALGSFESGNDYSRVNTVGCAGRWQFCPISLHGPGWGKYNGKRKKWLHDHAYQNERMINYTKNHWDQIIDLGLAKYLCREKTSTHGVRYTVTQGGMLAGAHLSGVYGLYNYLKGRGDAHDAYSTYTSDYVSRYQDTYITNKWASKKGNSLAGCRAFKKAARKAGGKNKVNRPAPVHSQRPSP